MTELLQKAFEEVARLPQEEQDSFAAWMLAEIASEHQWDRAFSGSADPLSALATEALNEHEEGKTRELDPDRL